MTKRFCDLCEKPAAERTQLLTQPGCGPMFDKSIGVKAIFGAQWTTTQIIENKRVDTSDPLDLCASCQCDLLRKLIDQIQGDPAVSRRNASCSDT